MTHLIVMQLDNKFKKRNDSSINLDVCKILILNTNETKA